MLVSKSTSKNCYNKSCHSLPSAAGTPLRGARVLNVMGPLRITSVSGNTKSIYLSDSVRFGFRAKKSKELILYRFSVKGLRSLCDGYAALDGCVIVVRRLGRSCRFNVEKNFPVSLFESQCKSACEGGQINKCQGMGH